MIAGVDPKLGLFASVVIAIVIAFAGGRPAMISAATAATAVVMTDLVRDHGVQYLFAATILMGVFQILAGLLKLGRLMRFVSQSVMTGFVNALAILIFLAQLPELLGVPPATYGLIALGLAIIYLFPRVTRAIPSPLVAIAVLTVAHRRAPARRAHGGASGRTALVAAGLRAARSAVDAGDPAHPAAGRADARGGRAARIAADRPDRRRHDRHDQQTRTANASAKASPTSPRRVFGGMGGCAMIGQSVINVSSGARGRLSTLVAGGFLLVLLVALQDLLAIVPVAALTAVMIMVSINTFSWRSLVRLRSNPVPSSVVMLATVATVVATSDLADGRAGGRAALRRVLRRQGVSALSRVISALSPDDDASRTYRVEGQVFFASAGTFADAIDVIEPVEKIVIDVGDAHFWDISAVGALDRVVLKARRHGREVEVVGLNAASATMVERFAVHDKEAAASAPPH